jgi:hypothetical protein
MPQPQNDDEDFYFDDEDADLDDFADLFNEWEKECIN